jgi:hypothetical protein
MLLEAQKNCQNKTAFLLEIKNTEQDNAFFLGYDKGQPVKKF